METENNFKGSPMHDNQAIINLLDNLTPEQMIRVVDLLQQKESKEIDYKELLKRYINHVDVCEGTNFIKHRYANSDLSEEDFEILEHIFEEDKKECVHEYTDKIVPYTGETQCKFCGKIGLSFNV